MNGFFIKHGTRLYQLHSATEYARRLGIPTKTLWYRTHDSQEHRSTYRLVNIPIRRGATTSFFYDLDEPLTITDADKKKIKTLYVKGE